MSEPENVEQADVEKEVVADKIDEPGVENDANVEQETVNENDNNQEVESAVAENESKVDDTDEKAEVNDAQVEEAEAVPVITEPVQIKPPSVEQHVVIPKKINLKLQEVVHFPKIFHNVLQFVGGKDLVRCSNVNTKWREFIFEKKLFEAECRRVWHNQAVDASRYNNDWKQMFVNSNRENVEYPHVYLDLTVNGQELGRILIKLDKHETPLTAENFRALCTGEKGISPVTNKPLHYKGSKIHSIIPGYVIQGGDIAKGDGTGMVSIYGEKFDDENFNLKHGLGSLSMANNPEVPNSNGCQFFICLTAKATPMNDKNVVFGRIIDGVELLKKLDIHGNQNGEVNAEVIIADCGQIGYNPSTEPVAQPYEAPVTKAEPEKKEEKKTKACTIL